MEIRTLRDSEIDLAFELDRDAFHQPEERRAFFRRFMDPAWLVGAFEGGRLLAMSGAIPLRQYFGGHSVRMGGLSSVAVVPDARGGGLAKQVIAGCIDLMRERGDAISTLFPATTSLYRSLGWEYGGDVAIRKLAPQRLRGLARAERGRARPCEASDAEGVRACYRALAARTNGCLDRPEHWWERCETRWRDHDRYLFEGDDGAVEGYLVYRQIDGEWSALGGDFGLVVEELVTLTPEAGLGLFGLLGHWSSQVDQVVLRRGVEAAMRLLLPEQFFQPLAHFSWMTRLVDVPAAVAARGFPPGLDVEVVLELRDGAGDAVRYALAVQKGRGQLSPARQGVGPVLHPRGLASLYTGWAGSDALCRAGLLAGGSAEEREALDAAFAGPTPWMLDQF